uniref:Ubiquitin n=1 Tax=Solanum tuberosum TaxID=4113 RepID=M1DZS4_SOLTU
MQYRSSTELANQFKIKREQLANERSDKAKKEHAPIAHKRKNSEDFIPQQGKSKLVEYKSVIQSSSREELGTSHMVVGKGQTKKSLFQFGESIQEKRTKLPMHNFRFQTSSQKGVTASVHVTGETLGNAEEQHDIQDLLNSKQLKRKSVLPATSLDQFLEEQQLQKEHDINDLPNCKQSKFLIPVEGKKWVMTGLRDAWRRHKQKIKERCFDKNSTVEDMLPKRPNDIPEACNQENNEEPSKCEMFIATCTKTGKEIQADTQVAINHQNFGETTDDAFTAVFGKEQPGRLRCYGRSVTTSSLKKDEETNELKQKHDNEITSLKEEINEMREEMRHFFSQLLQNNPGLNVRDMSGSIFQGTACCILESVICNLELHAAIWNLQFAIWKCMLQSGICNLQSGSACCNLESAICNLEVHVAIWNLQFAIWKCMLQSGICNLQSGTALSNLELHATIWNCTLQSGTALCNLELHAAIWNLQICCSL